jgi:hypothetical protein
LRRFEVSTVAFNRRVVIGHTLERSDAEELLEEAGAFLERSWASRAPEINPPSSSAARSKALKAWAIVTGEAA